MNKKHETYCNHDLINLLIKSGFNWIKYSVVHSLCDKDFHWEIPLHIAQKWLREVKNIDVFVLFEQFDPKINGYTYEIRHKGTRIILSEWVNTTYEGALEAGINKALEIILEKGE